MILTLEDGNGVVTANSYLTVAEANDLLSINIHTTWTMLDDPSKEKLLIWATRKLDERVRWGGRKLHGTSGLAWPRTGARDKEGQPIDDNLVPAQVKYATAVLANHLVAGDPDIANTSSNLTSLQVDVIVLKFDTNKAPEKYPTDIKYILAGLGSVSMGRGGPKFIVRH